MRFVFLYLYTPCGIGEEMRQLTMKGLLMKTVTEVTIQSDEKIDVVRLPDPIMGASYQIINKGENPVRIFPAPEKLDLSKEKIKAFIKFVEMGIILANSANITLTADALVSSNPYKALKQLVKE